jgi:hypothetical protein
MIVSLRWLDAIIRWAAICVAPLAGLVSCGFTVGPLLWGYHPERAELVTLTLTILAWSVIWFAHRAAHAQAIGALILWRIPVYGFSRDGYLLAHRFLGMMILVSIKLTHYQKTALSRRFERMIFRE